MPLLRDMLHSLRASPVFALFVLLTLGVAGWFGKGVVLGLLQLDSGMAQMGHFTDPAHRIHDLTFAFLSTTGIVGILAQLRRPSKNIAGMLMAVAPWGGLLLATVLSTSVRVMQSPPQLAPAVVTAFTALLHPNGRAFFRSFSLPRVNRVLLALVVVAAVPLLTFASTSIRLQATVLDSHAGPGHYGFMAAFSFTVIAVGLLASLRPDGWRLTAWVAGLLPALLGVSSLLYPDASSSLSLRWALAAIAWGAVFVATAELTKGKDAQRPAPPGSGDVLSRSAQG